MSRVSIFLAFLTIVGIAGYLLNLAALHFLRTDVNPMVEPVSNYAVGAYGFLSTAANIGSGLTASSEEHTSELQSRVDLVCRLFFVNDSATTGICTLSLHDALPILVGPVSNYAVGAYGFLSTAANVSSGRKE